MRLPRQTIMVFRGILFFAVSVSTYLALTLRHIPVVDDLHDPISHILAFYFLTLLFDFAFVAKPSLAIKIVALLGYGFAIEAFQGLFTERTFSLLDLGADAIGILFYVASIPLLRHLPWIGRRWDSCGGRG